MALEIERKFLVASDAWRAAATRRVTMRQGYLTEIGSAASVRVRLEGVTATLNIKQSVVGSARAEFEYAIPVADAETVIATLCQALVLKTRYEVPNAGHVWEVDEFEGDNAGLVVAELELGSEDEAFERPAWLGPEVTHEARYYNHALASRPYRTWPVNPRIDIDLTGQRLRLFDGATLIRDYPVSTAANGPGERQGSECTPRGRHRIRAKIGAGAPENAVFRGRRATGEVWTPQLMAAQPGRDWILTRILWLSGLEPGVNRFGEVDTFRRYIYLHGTPPLTALGVPGSKGCVRMANADIIELFDLVSAGTEVHLHP